MGNPSGFGVAFPGISFQDIFHFEGGFIQTFTVQAAPNLVQGFLTQYQNTNGRAYLVIDRIKVSADYTDNTSNYLVFSKTRIDGTWLQNYTVPINQILQGNPNYTNLLLIFKANQICQPGYVPTSSDTSLSQTLSWRVRFLDKLETEI